ncbi:MAG: hypothetical protein ABI972_03450 [Acidobacteriota bacterium]
MAKLGELSHSGHTAAKPLYPDPWPDDWPTVYDLHSFWLFGILRSKVAPRSAQTAELSDIEQWAIEANLVDRDGCVPIWVLYCGALPEFLSEHADRNITSNIFALDFDSPELPPYVMTVGQRANWRKLGDLIPGRLPDAESVRRQNLVSAVKSDLRYSVGHESRAKAKRRIMISLETWVDDQLDTCESRARRKPRGRKRAGFSKQELELFIRFQCERVPVATLSGSARPKKEDPGSTVRKVLKRVSARLGIKLRRDQIGRPRKNTGN